MNYKLFILVFVFNIVASSDGKPNEFTSTVLSSNSNKKNANWFKFGEKTYYIDTVFKVSKEFFYIISII